RQARSSCFGVFLHGKIGSKSYVGPPTHGAMRARTHTHTQIQILALWPVPQSLGTGSHPNQQLDKEIEQGWAIKHIVCVCVCVYERERGYVCVKESVCMCVRDRE